MDNRFSMKTIKTNRLSSTDDGEMFDDGSRGGVKRIHCAYGAQIDSIQITYSDGKGALHGCDKGNYSRTETLKEGEDVVEVSAMEHDQREKGLGFLHFKTNMGRVIEFNAACVTTGKSKTFVAPAGHRMTGIHGRAENVLNTFGVYWTQKYPMESNPDAERRRPDPTKAVVTQTKFLDAKERDMALPWHYYAIILSYCFLLLVLFSPAWSRYTYFLKDGNLCTVTIGPWGHSVRGDDKKCHPGYKDHDYAFFCNLGIDGVDENEKLEKELFNCQEARQGRRIALQSATVSCVLCLLALFMKFVAWKDHSWRERTGIIYVSFTCSLLAAFSASVAWAAWMKVVDAMDTVLDNTKNPNSELHSSIFINGFAIALLIISALCDVVAELRRSPNVERVPYLQTPLLSVNV